VLFPGTSGSDIGSPVVGLGLPGGGDGRFVYPTTFHPSAPTVAEANPMTVNAGEERGGIDFRLRPSPAVTVSGTVLGPEGPAPNTSVHLLPSGVELLSREYGFEAATAVSDRAGAFTFVGVTPGQYVIRVLRVPQRPQTTSTATTVVQVGTSTISSFTGSPIQPAIPDDPTLWAILPVSVGTTDVRGVDVALRPGARITGRVEFNGTTEKPTGDRLRAISVIVDAADGRSAGGGITAQSTLSRGQIDANGGLRTYQLPAGKYLVRATGTGGWTFAGAWHDGRDVSAVPLEVTGTDVSDVVLKFTDRPAELAGTVRDTNQTVATSGVVLLFPADSRAWTDYGPSARHFRSASLGPSGTYKFSAVAVGDYVMVAIGGGVPAEWQDPAFLKKAAAAAARVTIAEGDQKTQDLRKSVLR
jgi:hypothetical protein